MVVRFRLQDGNLVYMLTLRTRLDQANFHCTYLS